MDQSKAQQVIKAALDLATKAGIFQNLDAAAITAQAWIIITNVLNNNENTNA